MQNQLKNQSKNNAEKNHENSSKIMPKWSQDGSRNLPEFPGNRSQSDPETKRLPQAPPGAPRDPHHAARVPPRNPPGTLSSSPGSPNAPPRTTQGAPKAPPGPPEAPQGATTHARNSQKHLWHHSDRLPTIQANDNDNDIQQ